MMDKKNGIEEAALEAFEAAPRESDVCIDARPRFSRSLRSISYVLIGAFGLLSLPSFVPTAMAQKYPDTAPPIHDDHPSPNGGGRHRGGGDASSVIIPAIGIGLAIIGEVSRRKKERERQAAPPPPPKQTKKPPRRSKPPKKQTKKPRPPRKRPPSIARVIMPETLRLPRVKARPLTIGDKPWASDDSFVVALKPGVTQGQVQGFLQTYGLTQLGITRIGLLNQVILKLSYPEAMSPQLALAMASDERIFFAQPDYFYYPAVQPASGAAAGNGAQPADDDLQYALSKLGLSQFNGGQSGRNVALAVIDSGIDQTHPAFANRPIKKFSAFPDLPEENYGRDHGTAIASIIGAQEGMKGVAQGADLMSAQVFRYNDQGHMVADSFDIVRGIDWAVANGAKILNLSFAGRSDKLLETALRKAAERGVIAVAAAGNEGEGAPVAFPAGYASVIAVTATDFDDALYNFANRGDHVELAAPGVDVLVAAGGEGYGLQTGTSMATAYVSGSIALMLEKEPAMSIEAIKARLALSAVDLGPVGRDPEFGHGRLDALKAVTDTQKLQ